LGTFVFMCYGYNFRDSIFDFASLLTNSGFSFGIISSAATCGILLTGTAGMLIGRLEIFVVLLAAGSIIHEIRNRLRR